MLEQHMLPSRHLFQGKQCLFQQDNGKPRSACIITAWLRSNHCWPAFSPDLSPTMFGALWNVKCDKGDSKLLSSWNLTKIQNGKTFHIEDQSGRFPQLQLQCFISKKQKIQLSGKHDHHTFFGTYCWHQIINEDVIFIDETSVSSLICCLSFLISTKYELSMFCKSSHSVFI